MSSGQMNRREAFKLLSLGAIMATATSNSEPVFADAMDVNSSMG
tara:strand:+ start:287 stop:418 length:132 start_codon:yes stop_codon:yes gene_type:complete